MHTMAEFQQFIEQYPEIDRLSKHTNHDLYTFLVEREQDYLSYLVSCGIPLYSALSICSKLVTDLCYLVELIIRSICERRYAGANIQTYLMDFTEYGRNILGILLGIPVAVMYSPKFAAEVFLIPGSETNEPVLTPVQASYLYAMANKLHAFFSKYNIDYRICCGTALGALRERGIIKNDDDIDLIVHPDSVERLTQLIENGTLERETGVIIRKQFITGGWQCFYEECNKGQSGTPTEHIGLPFVDIFKGMWRYHGEKRVITYSENRMYYQVTGDHFTEEEWRDHRLYDFGPTKLRGIVAMAPYLKRCYGPLALDYIARYYPHEVYSNIYGRPHSIFTELSKHNAPRYIRHKRPSPLTHDEATYHYKISLGEKCIYVGEIDDLFHEVHEHSIRSAINQTKADHPNASLKVLVGICSEGVATEEQKLLINEFMQQLQAELPDLVFEIISNAHEHAVDIFYHSSNFKSSTTCRSEVQGFTSDASMNEMILKA